MSPFKQVPLKTPIIRFEFRIAPQKYVACNTVLSTQGELQATLDLPRQEGPPKKRNTQTLGSANIGKNIFQVTASIPIFKLQLVPLLQKGSTRHLGYIMCRKHTCPRKRDEDTSVWWGYIASIKITFVRFCTKRSGMDQHTPFLEK